MEAVRKIASVSDLARLKIPVVSETFVNEVKEAQKDLNNLVGVPATQSLKMVTAPKPPEVYTFELPASDKDKLDRLNFPYAEEQGKDKLTVIVVGKDQLKTFCQNFPKACK
jgi:hypothetical protein